MGLPPKYTVLPTTIMEEETGPSQTIASVTLGSFSIPISCYSCSFLESPYQILRSALCNNCRLLSQKNPTKKRPLLHFQIEVGGSPLHLRSNFFVMIQHKKCRHTDSSTISPRPPTITTSQVPLRFADIPSIYPSASATWPVNCIPHRTGKNCKGTAWGTLGNHFIICRRHHHHHHHQQQHHHHQQQQQQHWIIFNINAVLPTFVSTSGASPQGWFCIAAPAYWSKNLDSRG